jgi:uncharacterized SAM-binding protein YcdF (DUF218 family)
MTARRSGAWWLWLGIRAVVLAVGAAWLGALWAVWWAGRRDEARPAAAIVILGAAQYDGRPSPVLRARLDHGVALWRRGVAPHVIVTGGGRVGDRSTEAAAGRRYVVSRGVPDSAVLLGELQRTAPAGSVAAAAPSAVFVSDPFHMLRIGVLARRYGIVAYTSPTPTSPISANPRLVLEYLARESLKVPFVLLTEHPADE